MIVVQAAVSSIRGDLYGGLRHLTLKAVSLLERGEGFT